MKKILILQLVLFLSGGVVLGQSATGLVFVAPLSGGTGVQVKWLTPEIASSAGYNLYRREAGGSDWERLNAAPLAIGTVALDPAMMAADSSLRIAHQIARQQEPESLPPLARVNFLTAAITVPDFARFLGIHYDDLTAAPGTRYEYEVRSLKTGRENLVGRSKAIAPGDEPAFPSAPAITGEYVKSAKSVSFNWDHSPDEVFAYHLDRIDPATGTRLRLNERPIIILNSNDKVDSRYNDPTPGNAQAYRYELSAIDYLGRISPVTSAVVVELPDLLPPAAPTDPASDNSVDGEVTLSWAPSVDPDVTTYRIARTASVEKLAETVGTVNAPTTSYHDDRLPGYGYYYYEIYAIDAAGNESPVPLFHIANATDLSPPAPPANVRISAEAGEIALDWAPNREGDLAGYVVLRSMDVKGTGTWATLHVEAFAENRFVDKLPPSRRNTMIYAIVALDTTGNRSEPSAIVRMAMPDETPPPVPFLQSVRTTGDSLYLTWQPVTEADMRGYRLERKTEGEFSVIGTPAKGDNVYLDTGLAAGARVAYRLSSVDTTGNVSVPSQPLSTTMPRAGSTTRRFALEGKYRKRSEGVALQWSAEAGKSFVFRRKGGSGRFLPLNQEITNNKFIDQPGESGRYDYFIKTYYPDGSRAESQVLTVVVK